MISNQSFFRDFAIYDYSGYSGVIDLPNGERPKIHQHTTKDGYGVDFIISGNGAGDSLITMVTEASEYLVCIPSFNMCHYSIAEAMIKYFEDYDLGSDAVEAIVSDFGMINILGG